MTALLPEAFVALELNPFCAQSLSCATEMQKDTDHTVYVKKSCEKRSLFLSNTEKFQPPSVFKLTDIVKVSSVHFPVLQLCFDLR